MKKKICLLLALLFTFLFAFSAFAATDDTNDPLLLPTSSDTVTGDQYGEFDDNPVPETAPIVEIIEEELPEALPQTGGIPAEAFYIIGGICIISAILLLVKKEKPSTK